MFFVLQETTLKVILPVTVSLEQRNVCQSGLVRTARYSARPEMIPWANTSARLMEADSAQGTGLAPAAVFSVLPEKTTWLTSLAIR